MIVVKKEPKSSRHPSPILSRVESVLIRAQENSTPGMGNCTMPSLFNETIRLFI